ncbi:thioredoxin-like protein [Scenedesmus sp. NREL 46B-D3]|nr:thioredoxin-like protein [Scenedesmus sp. NREL 46B-D3]
MLSSANQIAKTRQHAYTTTATRPCMRPLTSSRSLPRNHRNNAAHATAANIRQVNAEELEAAIAARDKPIVVDFFATWCGPCLLLAQELEKVAGELGEGIDVLKLDVDQNADLSTRLQIQGLPTMIFIGMDNNKPALRTEGLLPAETIKNIIKNEL